MNKMWNIYWAELFGSHLWVCCDCLFFLLFSYSPILFLFFSLTEHTMPYQNTMNLYGSCAALHDRKVPVIVSSFVFILVFFLVTLSLPFMGYWSPNRLSRLNIKEQQAWKLLVYSLGAGQKTSHYEYLIRGDGCWTLALSFIGLCLQDGEKRLMVLQMGEGCSSLWLNLGDKWGEKNYHTYLFQNTASPREWSEDVSHPDQCSFSWTQACKSYFCFSNCIRVFFFPDWSWYFIFQQSRKNCWFGLCLFN